MLPEETRPEDVKPVIEPEQPTKTTKFFNKIVLLALIATAISLGIFMKWSFADTNVLVVNNSPFPARVVKDPSGQTGGIVFLTADYCKNVAVTGTLRMSYVSKSSEVFLPIASEKLEKGCQKTDVPVVIPKSLPQDVYKIKFHAVYNVNPLKQDIAVDFESQEFEVSAQ